MQGLLTTDIHRTKMENKRAFNKYNSADQTETDNYEGNNKNIGLRALKKQTILAQ